MTSLLILLVAFVAGLSGESSESASPVGTAPSVRPAMRPFRMDGDYVSTPSDWTSVTGESTPTRRAYRRGDAYLATIGAYDRGAYEPASEEALVTEVEELVASAQQADPDQDFQNDTAIPDMSGDVHRAWVDARTERDAEPVRLRYVVSYDPRVDRFLFIALHAYDGDLSDKDLDTAIEDLLWWFELDAFDPDADPTPASFG